MRNSEIAAAMTELATLYELDGAVRYRVIAYREAARVIEGSPVSVADLALAGKATELPGIGDTLQGKIVDLVNTGEIPAAAKLKAKFPASLVEVTRLPGLGAKTARRLYDELGIATLEDLREAAAEGKVRGMKGLGEKFELGVIEAIDRMGEEGAPGRVLLSKVLPVAEQLAEALREHPACDQVTIAGSARRWAETCKDIDLIATATDPAALAKALAENPLAAQAGSAGPAGTRIVTFDGIAVDLRIVEPEAYGNLLQHFTGLRRAQHRRCASAPCAWASRSPSTASPTPSPATSPSTRPRRRSTSASVSPTSSRSSARATARSRPRRRASCPSWSSSAICGATCTATRRSRTGATRSPRWPRRRASAATPTWP